MRTQSKPSLRSRRWGVLGVLAAVLLLGTALAWGRGASQGSQARLLAIPRSLIAYPITGIRPGPGAPVPARFRRFRDEPWIDGQLGSPAFVAGPELPRVPATALPHLIYPTDVRVGAGYWRLAPGALHHKRMVAHTGGGGWLFLRSGPIFDVASMRERCLLLVKVHSLVPEGRRLPTQAEVDAARRIEAPNWPAGRSGRGSVRIHPHAPAWLAIPVEMKAGAGYHFQEGVTPEHRKRCYLVYDVLPRSADTTQMAIDDRVRKLGRAATVRLTEEQLGEWIFVPVEYDKMGRSWVEFTR